MPTFIFTPTTNSPDEFSCRTSSVFFSNQSLLPVRLDSFTLQVVLKAFGIVCSTLRFRRPSSASWYCPDTLWSLSCYLQPRHCSLCRIVCVFHLNNLSSFSLANLSVILADDVKNGIPVLSIHISHHHEEDLEDAHKRSTWWRHCDDSFGFEPAKVSTDMSKWIAFNNNFRTKNMICKATWPNKPLLPHTRHQGFTLRMFMYGHVQAINRGMHSPSFYSNKFASSYLSMNVCFARVCVNAFFLVIRDGFVSFAKFFIGLS